MQTLRHIASGNKQRFCYVTYLNDVVLSFRLCNHLPGSYNEQLVLAWPENTFISVMKQAVIYDAVVSYVVLLLPRIQ